MNLTSEQQHAIAQAVAFCMGSSSKPIFTIGGLAGTGKTTILARVCENLISVNEGFVVGCPTGKAASVLNAKSIPAATIHKLAYACSGKDKHGKLQFDFVGIAEKQDRDSDSIGTLIIDEASMVSQQMLQDLSSSGLRMLFCGDYGQLPPVGGDPGLMKNLDVKLTEVHRQGGHLLEVCYALREDRAVMKHFFSNPDVVRYTHAGSPDAWDWMQSADVILVGSNKTRHDINSLKLERAGILLPTTIAKAEIPKVLLESKLAVPAVCVSNNYSYGIMNGESGFVRVTQVYEDADVCQGEWYDTRPQEGMAGLPVLVNQDSFYSNPGDVPFHADGLKLDFGYAMTVHKAQGSEWPHVAVIDHGNMRWDADQYRRWRYTAATRAQQKLTWIGNRRAR